MRERAVWASGGTLQVTPDLTGFKVKARDGQIGRVDVDAATPEHSPGYLVVDTGRWIFRRKGWIFSRKVMLPGGVLRDVDVGTETIYVDLTKDEVENAPEFDEARLRDAEHQNGLGNYSSGDRTMR